MGEVFFVIKNVILTVLLVSFLQIEIEGRSLENRFSSWVHTSAISRWADQAAKSATYIFQDMGAQVRKLWAFKAKSNEGSEQSPIHGRLSFVPRRSDQYIQIENTQRYTREGEVLGLPNAQQSPNKDLAGIGDPD